MRSVRGYSRHTEGHSDNSRKSLLQEGTRRKDTWTGTIVTYWRDAGRTRTNTLEEVPSRTPQQHNRSRIEACSWRNGLKASR